MAFPPGFLDTLRGRISLPGLVARRVRLTRRGRELAGLCPFHHEKTPSFYVVEDKDFFHCFGCGAHGDAIGFVMRADNVDFLEAVEKLAAEAGIEVPQASPQERERAQRQKTLLDALEAAAVFYEARLWAPGGSRARDYLRGRGLDQDAIRRFRLGWAPEPSASADRQELRRALSGEFPEPLLLEAGLLHRPEQGEAFDYFRGRIMFPIGDRAGRVIAFGGRVIGDLQPKYLNSPDSPVFAKGQVLYGWSAARAAAAAGHEPIVTEGYMDVIALQRAGLAAAVAPLGTALSERQLQELWRLGSEPVLCFDGDLAGQRAAARALRRALPLLRPGHSLRFAVLPAGEDPDSLLTGGGRAAFDRVLAAARPLSRVLWELELGSRPADTPERRADLERRLGEDVALIADRAVQAEYRRFVRQRLYEHGRTARRGARSPLQPGGPAFVRQDAPAMPRAPQRAQLEILFRMLLREPRLIDEVAEDFAALDIPEPALDKLRHEILEIEALRPGLDAPALRQHLSMNGFAATVDALLSPSVDSGFLVRRSDPRTVRREWAHVIGMLMGAHGSPSAEAGRHLRDEVSAAGWERFLAVREQLLRGEQADDDVV